MKEQDLIDLGFEKFDETDGGDNDYYYYTLDIGNDYVPMCLISNASDEAKENNWTVSIFDYESIEFSNLEDVKNLIELLKNNIK
jgi:hypothetical protein